MGSDLVHTNRNGRYLRAAPLLLTLALVVAACGGGSGAPTGQAPAKPSSDLPIVSAPDQEGVQHLHFSYGPIKIAPGQNNITFSNLQVPKPTVDGFIVAIRPNLVRKDGTVPPVDVLHLHHGVWVSLGSGGLGGRAGGAPAAASAGSNGAAAGGPSSTGANPSGGANRPRTSGAARAGGAGGDIDLSRVGSLFFAVGEEKTIMMLPAGYGYPYKATDRWIINYMLHNLLPTPDEVSMVYDIDFIPADSPGAKKITPARPVWMDVQSGNLYPVFDVQQGTGTNGVFTYPDQANDPYKGGRIRNQWTVDRDSVMIATAGHVHPGGLHTDLFVTRAGAGATAPDAAKASIQDDKAHVFRSDAIYYEPAGAVSWDVSMTATRPDWRVAVKKGDVMSVSASYDSARASWYEAMGIMIVWMTDGSAGTDPFQSRVDTGGAVLTHGHLPENNNHGGTATNKYVDFATLPNGPEVDTITVSDFTYAPGDMGGIYNAVPVVKAGQSLKFVNKDAPLDNGIWHTITACKNPCASTTGVAYPLADGPVQFDSGELGTAGAPTAGRVDWTVPPQLPTGTYTYFCRIHPSMRGAFRVLPEVPAAQ
jgi:plastocyanin